MSVCIPISSSFMAFSFRKSRLTGNSRRTTVSSQRILLLERVDYEVPLWQYHDATSTVVFESVSPSPQVVPSLVTVDVDEIVVCLSRLKRSEISSYNNFFILDHGQTSQDYGRIWECPSSRGGGHRVDIVPCPERTDTSLARRVPVRGCPWLPAGPCTSDSHEPDAAHAESCFYTKTMLWQRVYII